MGLLLRNDDVTRQVQNMHGRQAFENVVVIAATLSVIYGGPAAAAWVITAAKTVGTCAKIAKTAITVGGTKATLKTIKVGEQLVYVAVNNEGVVKVILGATSAVASEIFDLPPGTLPEDPTVYVIANATTFSINSFKEIYRIWEKHRDSQQNSEETENRDSQQNSEGVENKDDDENNR